MNQKKYFNISERKILLRVIDVIIIVAGLFLSFNFLEFNYFNFKSESITGWVLLLITYYLVFGEIFQLFNLNVSNSSYLVLKSLVLTVFVTSIFYVFTPFLSPVLPSNRLQIVYLFLIILLPVLIWRFIYIQVIFSPKYFKTILFIGKAENIEKMIKQIKGDNFHNLRAYYSDKEIAGVPGFRDINSEDLSAFFTDNSINEVVVSKVGLSNDVVHAINKELIYLFQKGLSITSYESFYEALNTRVPKEYLEHNFYKYINFSKNNTNRFYLFGLRTTDLIVSFLGTIICLLFVPLILICNLFSNRGSLFYTQVRVGQNGKSFKIFKFRSMIANAEKDGAVWAKKNDTRITTFGKFLRSTRIDEFPQFFNILKGDMSIIGPRPERPEFVKDLEDKIPFYAIRHVVRPGLTGWAQVKYPYANTLEEQETKLRYDLYYIKERSAFLDFKILIKTVTTVLFFRGQ